MFQRPGKTRVIRYLYTPYRGRVQVNVAKIAFQQSEALSALCARFSPFNSGFSRKAREFNYGLGSKYNHIEVAGRVKGCYNDLIRIVCNCLKILSFISDTHRTCSCEGIRTCHIV